MGYPQAPGRGAVLAAAIMTHAGGGVMVVAGLVIAVAVTLLWVRR